MFNNTNRANTIILLESLTAEKDNISKGTALAFASKSLELIKKSVGKESEQYRLMNALFYDQTALHIEKTIYPADSLIVLRVKMDDNYTSIIDSCIEFVNSFGLFKPPTDKKNIFGDLNNSMLWTIISSIAIGSFSLGIIYSNLNISNLLNPKQEIIQTKSQNKKEIREPQKSQHPIDSVTTK